MVIALVSLLNLVESGLHVEIIVRFVVERQRCMLTEVDEIVILLIEIIGREDNLTSNLMLFEILFRHNIGIADSLVVRAFFKA